MRRWLLVAVMVLVAAVPIVLTSPLRHGLAQTAPPVGDEFNGNTFAAPFQVTCAQFASAQCPDAQGPTTWSLNTVSPGQLRIMTQFGSLFGLSTQSSNNARNLVLQPFNSLFDFTATTKLSFPAVITNVTALNQTAGMIIYQDDDNFIYLGRLFTQSGVTQLVYTQEINGVDTTYTVNESGTLQPIVYLRIVKTSSSYQGFYSYDNVNFIPITAPVATPTPLPTPTTGTSTATPIAATPTAIPPAVVNFVASYASPKVGLVAFGGTNAAVNNATLPADFDWFRIGNSQIPATTVPATVTTTPGTAVATSTPTLTSTPILTSTPVPTSSPTVTPTLTPTPTPTPTSTPTATPTPTNTPRPTATPRPAPHKFILKFNYVSLWYHKVRQGTWDYLSVQSNHKIRQGIWVTVRFPVGKKLGFYENTDSKGHWARRFNVPKGTAKPGHHTGIVTVQLWHGKTTAKSFVRLTVL